MPDMLGTFESNEPFMSLYDDNTRFLAGGGGKPTFDYTIFGMAFIAMILLLIVDVTRHKIDHVAKEHHFFGTVMEACYHECKNNKLYKILQFYLNHI